MGSRCTAYVNEKNSSKAAWFPWSRNEKEFLENLVVSWKIEGRRARRWQRLKYLDSLCTRWKDKVNPTQLIRATEDRLLWQHLVAKVINDDTALLFNENACVYILIVAKQAKCLECLWLFSEMSSVNAVIRRSALTTRTVTARTHQRRWPCHSEWRVMLLH